jgi:hypothetical protein
MMSIECREEIRKKLESCLASILRFWELAEATPRALYRAGHAHTVLEAIHCAQGILDKLETKFSQMEQEADAKHRETGKPLSEVS